MKKDYIIDFNTYIDCILNKDFKSICWSTFDLLLLKIDSKLIPITINENYESIRHFLNLGYDNYISSIKLSKRIDETSTLKMWNNESDYKDYKVYNMTKMIKYNILNENYINIFLETKDNIVRDMIIEIIINKLNNLNNGNN